MSYKKRLEKMGATPGKLALVGVLALVLVMVIAKQFPESAPENTNLNPTVNSQLQAKTEKVSAKKIVATDSQQESKFAAWPQIDLSEALANDPFALPSWAIEKEPDVVAGDKEPGELLALQEQGASIVVIGKETKSATIGEQNLSIGDILEGYRVTDITTNGIFLDKLAPQ